MNSIIHIPIVSFKSPELLIPCINSILETKSEKTSLSVVLNEGDAESINFLWQKKIKFTVLEKNYGQLAVDFAFIPKCKYILFPNDDMLFCPDWENEIIETMDFNGGSGCSTSMFLIEPDWWGNPTATKDQIIEGTDSLELKKEKFFINWKEGQYFNKIKNIITWNHPITVSYEDWISVGGYSDNFNMEFWPGAWTDDYFAFRLWKKYNGNFKFLITKKACVYHGVSKTFSKARVSVPESVFIKYCNMTPSDFKHQAKQYQII